MILRWFSKVLGKPVDADETNALPVAIVSGGSGGASGAFTDRSGTVAAGGTSQQAAAANASRRYLLIENVSTGDLWANFGTAAVASQPSIRISAGGSYEPVFIPTSTVNVIGVTTGQAYVCKEA